MANITRNFIKGRMNKSVDERLIPDGEYIDAINVRMGSTESSEIGVIENTKGNLGLTELQYNNEKLSTQAKCIGAFEDGANETIYWFVHDPYFARDGAGLPTSLFPTGKIDLIVSYNATDNIIDYHVISVNNGDDVNTTLNFNPKYLITGVDLVENLLFFTDNINPPRFINIKSGYDNPVLSAPRIVDYGNNPSLLSERLLVIKRPPLYAPTIELQEIPSAEDNYLEDRYICFAYRYRYADGEYSATSPFSDPAFVPENFNFSVSSLLNEGMVNAFNSINVSYNTGGTLVESVELLFKEAQNSIIKVIDKFNKTDQGFADNATETYTFTNSNIFTILPDSEILRLYDNVPRFALAQTIMGNRLIYGNYIDGYNLERNGVPTQIEYTVDLISEKNEGISIDGQQRNKDYSIPSRGFNVSCNGTARLSFTSIADKLKRDSLITINLSFKHHTFRGPNTPQVDTPEEDITVSFALPQDYATPYDLVTSDAFINAIGNISPKNIQPVYAPSPATTSCDGVIFTDDFNCVIPNTLSTSTGSVQKWGSAVSGNSLVGANAYANNEPLFISMNPSAPFANQLFITIPYMRFVDDVNQGSDIFQDVYEFYEITASNLTFKSSKESSSLHSNRGYETGIVYMDEFGRSSTALVSNNNSLHIPCSESTSLNKIQVTIPPRQIAPEWATNYKFVIKPDEENYDVIYSNVYYQENTEANVFFLLEGENAKKVEQGDRLIVKRDSSGARSGCVYVTVLEKIVFASSEIEEGSFAGTYMKINPNTINTEEDVNSFYPMNRYVEEDFKNDCPFQTHVLALRTGPPYQDVDIPPGSIFKIENITATTNIGAWFKCPERTTYISNITIVATRQYSNLGAWLNAIDFNKILEENNTGSNPLVYYPNISSTPTCLTAGYDQSVFTWIQGDGVTFSSFIQIRGYKACGGTTNRRSRLDVRMSLRRTDQTIIFETEPQDALPDVWFESADTYKINSDGFHQGDNDVYQTATTPAIVTTDFYNCYSFGNGAESYKIRDSIVGKTFNLGNRIYTTDEKEYKEAHRFADLTYSGVYNEENNINKLNEFNLGLLNFKPLERTFGPIQKLFGRETDILTLQEDRISYVLQGKEMITGATGGSALVTVPEILGKQVARTEEYGISNNPESFVQWGADKYFTDAKRGAVIQLKGSAAQNEKLTVISEQGMRSWFRDLFIESFETQKLGGFDPYMDEYVLSSNDIVKPVDIDCIDCGVIVGNIVVDVAKPYDFCVDVGDLVGDVTIDIDIDSSVSGNQSFRIDYTYAGVTNTYFSASTPISDTITIQKSSVADQKVTLVVENSSTNKSYIRGINVGCPEAETITIIPVSITSDAINGQYIHSEYSWTDGAFVSPLHSRLVSFDNDNTTEFVISDYDQITGLQGAGVIPADSATVSMICNKINFDDFVFSEGVLSPLPPTPNNFRYLRTNTRYYNTIADIKLLLAETLTDPDGGVPAINSTDAPDKYSATFTMPNQGAYLYLIWDYRLSTEDDLCFGATIEDSCCTC